MLTRFVTDPNLTGWMLAVPDGLDPAAVVRNPNRGISLPWCLKVDLLKAENGRDFFQILEGSLKGTRASLKLRDVRSSYLTAENLHRQGGSIRLSRQKQQLWYEAQGPFSAFSELGNPVPIGIHDLEIPDFPHPDYYPESSKYQQVWFRVGHSGDRYLHLGTISHGCATVRPWMPDKQGDRRFATRSDSELGLPAPVPVGPFAKWDDICKYLMRCRKGDDRSVGTLHVLD
jgi:hypothetical protein